MTHSIKEQLSGKRILFATIPGDGHFNPLTGLAKYLQQQESDVRWYTSNLFADKLQKLAIPHYPFQKALDVNAGNFDDLFPERITIADPAQRIVFDLIHYFEERSVEFYEDIQQLYTSFPFDILIADNTFSAIPFVKAKMKIPVVAIGVIPLAEESVDLAPYGMALPPPKNEVERAEYATLREVNTNLLKEAMDVYEAILDEYAIPHQRSQMIDLLIKQADRYLQIGTPSFEYTRSDLGENVYFIGGLLPYSFSNDATRWFDQRLKQYKKVILVTQGTVERNTQKILEPTIEAFTNTDFLVIATTGGHGTEELREKYKADNIIIKEYISFDDVMPYAHVYVTNGGYSGTLLSIKHKLPMVAAGLFELKNEICTRIGHFNYGINLATETPTPQAIREAVEEVIQNPVYKNNVARLSEEMLSYNANELCAQHIAELISEKA